MKRIAATGPIWFISDLHLGDGTPSDVFFGKDRQLMALIQRVDRQGGILIVNGDAMDFHQAWSFTRILRAHQEVLGAMSRLARQGRLYYLTGNHDYDINLYREILQFEVCDRLEIGDEILVTHGYEYDPVHSGKDLAKGQWSTKMHHFVERYFQTWIRIPLGEFYTLPNRFVFWAAHKAAVVGRMYCSFAALFGFTKDSERLNVALNFWVRSNLGDPMCMFDAMWKHLHEGKWRYIVCGHSHLPGQVRSGDRAYINTGSWTFGSSHYVRWSEGEFEVRDWMTGATFEGDYYENCVDGSIGEHDFWQWYGENYMGFLRFREGEERRVRMRGWESYIRERQSFSHLPLD